VTPVLYLHGFASGPESAKVELLRSALGSDGFVLTAPDLNVPSFERLAFSAMVETAVRTGRDLAPRVIVGSSLGALVALAAIARGVIAPLVLIAPALGVVEHWLPHIPDGDPVRVFHHARNADAPIHRAFFDEIAAVDVDREPPPVPVTIFMGADDETVPFDRVTGVYDRWRRSGRLHRGSRFIEIVAGDHRLLGTTDDIAAAVRHAFRGE
jgi:fermentation-respiration switch protein FrsA (DUF1100 family)